MSPEETRMIEAIDRSREKLHKIARRIWEFKEVGWEEFNSSLLLMNELEREGFEVERGLTGRHPKFDQEIDMPTAFKAVFRGKEDGPVVGVLLEYDALPNGHACGHNLISSAGFAAALGLKEAFQEKGTVVVYGTPAEELEGSKHYILEGGYMDEVDLMLANHYGSDWGSEVTGKAIVWPTHDNWVTFKGRASHASSSPEKGRSALDAVILTTMGLEFLREHMPETNRIHYIISKGGTAANSVPDLATLNVELRTNDSAELNSLMKRVDNVIKGAALMTDTTPVYRWDAPWYCATPAPTLYRRAALYAADLGIDSLLRPDGRSGSGRAPRRPGSRPALKRGSRGRALQAVILSVHDRRRMDGPAHHAEQLHRFLYETVNAGLQRRLVSVLSGKTSSQVQNAHYSAGNLLCDWICADYV